MYDDDDFNVAATEALLRPERPRGQRAQLCSWLRLQLQSQRDAKKWVFIQARILSQATQDTVAKFEQSDAPFWDTGPTVQSFLNCQCN